VAFEQCIAVLSYFDNWLINDTAFSECGFSRLTKGTCDAKGLW